MRPGPRSLKLPDAEHLVPVRVKGVGHDLEQLALALEVGEELQQLLGRQHLPARGVRAPLDAGRRLGSADSMPPSRIASQSRRTNRMLLSSDIAIGTAPTRALAKMNSGPAARFYRPVHGATGFRRPFASRIDTQSRT